MRQATRPERISLRCPGCEAKLRASVSLLGHTCPCPRCKHRVVVRLTIPSDADVYLVTDGEGRQ